MKTLETIEMRKLQPTELHNNRRDLYWLLKVLVLFILFLLNYNLQAQSVAGSTWDQATATPGAGYTNWGNGVITLTDTITGSGACQGAAVIESGGYNPTTNFEQCFRVFFGCPGNDVIGSGANPYTDQNGDGMAFSFFKSNATYNANNGNTCGGGLGYDNALTGGDNDGKMITIEFDTYSSLGTSTVDGSYGGGAPGSGSINDEISVHKDQNSNDGGLLAGSTVNTGNLEDGLEHEVCISYNATTRLLNVSIDGVGRLVNYNMATSGSDLNTYFNGATLSYSWSAGKYGATNMQTIAPSGVSIFGTIGHNLCTNELPVTMIRFTGNLIHDQAVLNWATATEKNNKEFIIERSNDGFNWSSIGAVQGAGDAIAIKEYTYTDYYPLDGISYYRLKQVDFDGTYTYTKVVAVEKGKISRIQIVPNPFDAMLSISNTGYEKLDVYIYDMLGKLVYAASSDNSGSMFTIHPELASGTYMVTVITDTFVETQKIIRR